jgi:serine/threonine protein phosphatase PrpC
MKERKETASPAVPAYAVDAAIGRRSEQQDKAWAGPIRLANGEAALLLVVADGMGGAAGGQVASATALAAFRQRFEADGSVSSLTNRLRSAVQAANQAIAAAIARDRTLTGMGTTFIGAVLHDGKITWVSVGDSLLLAVHDGVLRRLNEDHSLAVVLDAAAGRGEISVAEAQSSTQRNVLRSALTGGRIAMIELDSASLKRGAWLIAATDGILTLQFAKVSQLAGNAREPHALAQAILAAIAEDMPADQDNVTLAVTRAMPRRGSRSKAPPWAMVVIGLAVVAFLMAMAGLGTLLVTDDGPADNHVGAPASPEAAPPAAKGGGGNSEPPMEKANVNGIETSHLAPATTPGEVRRGSIRVDNPSPEKAPTQKSPGPKPVRTPPPAAPSSSHVSPPEDNKPPSAPPIRSESPELPRSAPRDTQPEPAPPRPTGPIP